MKQTKFKKVPFNLELAKKITNKDVKGRIVTRDGLQARIICFDFKHCGSKNNIIALIDCGDYELASKYDSNGKVKVMQDEYDLHIEVPTYHKDYSNFKPCKWQPCLVRDYSSDTWRIEVCCGIDSNGVPIFYSRNNSDGYEDYKHFLPLSNITKRLIGTSNSYEDLIKELDAESTATTKNNDNGNK